MKIYPLKNKLIISFSPLINIVIKVYIEDGLLLSDIFHEKSVQLKELDCGLPLFNENVMGDTTVEHILKLLNTSVCEETWELLTYNDAQVEMYNSLAASRFLYELFNNCPNLAWAIILNNYYGASFHVVEYLSRMKRRQLLSILTNSPAEERNITLLKKVKLLSGRRNEFRWLSRCLKEAELVEAYKHKETVTMQELYLSYRYRILAGSKLLKNVCHEKKEFLRDYKKGMCTLHKLAIDSVRIGENIGIKDSINIIMNCPDGDAVMYYHDKWSLKLRETTKLLREDIFLERPMLLDCEGIAFIDSINALIIEGREMEHCLASYKDKVINKESYIYKVTSFHGERVTLELGFLRGKYFIKQAKGFRNSEPSNPVRGFYNTWLDDENERLMELDKEKKEERFKLQRA